MFGLPFGQDSVKLGSLMLQMMLIKSSNETISPKSFFPTFCVETEDVQQSRELTSSTRLTRAEKILRSKKARSAHKACGVYKTCTVL